MIYIELAIIVVLICLNGLLAMAELAVVSSRRSRLQAFVDRDIIGSRRALALASDPGKFLSTVQIGITLVGVLSGACDWRPSSPLLDCPRAPPKRPVWDWSSPSSPTPR
jgi:CBS domain containing-hemolysin-like protein